MLIPDYVHVKNEIEVYTKGELNFFFFFFFIEIFQLIIEENS